MRLYPLNKLRGALLRLFGLFLYLLLDFLPLPSKRKGFLLLLQKYGLLLLCPSLLVIHTCLFYPHFPCMLSDLLVQFPSLSLRSLIGMRKWIDLFVVAKVLHLVSLICPCLLIVLLQAILTLRKRILLLS